MGYGYFISSIFFGALTIMASAMQIKGALTISGICTVVVLIAAAARGFSFMLVMAVLSAFVFPQLPAKHVYWFALWALVAITLTAKAEDNGSRWYTISAEIFEGAFYIITIVFACWLLQKRPNLDTTSVYLGASLVLSFFFKSDVPKEFISKRILLGFSAACVAYFLYLHVGYSLTVKI